MLSRHAYVHRELREDPSAACRRARRQPRRVGRIHRERVTVVRCRPCLSPRGCVEAGGRNGPQQTSAGQCVGGRGGPCGREPVATTAASRSRLMASKSHGCAGGHQLLCRSPATVRHVLHRSPRDCRAAPARSCAISAASGALDRRILPLCPHPRVPEPDPRAPPRTPASLVTTEGPPLAPPNHVPIHAERHRQSVFVLLGQPCTVHAALTDR